MAKRLDSTDGELVVHPTTLVRYGDINPSAYNPRRIAAAKASALEASIRKNGFVEPLVVQRKGMNLIGGHQRRAALARIAGAGVDELEVPCVVLDLDDRAAKLLNIALNNTEGEFDDGLLRSLLMGIERKTKLTDAERLSIGFSDRELDRLLEPPRVTGGDGGGAPFATSVTLSLAFDSVAERDAVKGLLAESSARSNKRSGTIVRELLERSTEPAPCCREGATKKTTKGKAAS